MRRATIPSPEIITKVNVTPIIDVALVLVIILLVTAPMISAVDTRIQLPEARTRSADNEANISLTLGPEGDLKVDQQRVTASALQRALHARLSEPGGEGRLVVVRADASVPYAKVGWLLDQARQAGATHLAIATRQKALRPPSGSQEARSR